MVRFTLDPSTIQRLDEFAERWGTSRSAAVDRIVASAKMPPQPVMVVKVQASDGSSEKPRRVMVMSEDRSFFHEGPIRADMANALDGRPHAFFKATITKDDRLVLMGEVADPGWESP